MTPQQYPSAGRLLPILRAHALLAALVVLFVGLATVFSHIHALPVNARAGLVAFRYFIFFVPQLVFLVLFWRLLQLTYVRHEPDRMSVLYREVRGFLRDRNRMIAGALAFTLMVAVNTSYGQFKSLIPRMNPFSWDVPLMELDRALHFGVDPYVIVHALFGWDFALSQFTLLYSAWLVLAWFILLGACFMRPEHPARMQYLVAYLLTWSIGGVLLAVTFSSAGPVYFARLGLPDIFAPLMERLQAHAATGASSVLATQDQLWQFYSENAGIGAISAFPSMHVASSTLMALLGFRIARWMGWALTAFAVVIMIGSVLLAWHYAVDGYVGALIAILCWKASGWLVGSGKRPLPQS